MKNFIEKIDENSIYTKVYRFIQEEFTANDVFDRMTVLERYRVKTTEDKETIRQTIRQFDTHYYRVIQSLLQEGKIRRFSHTRRNGKLYYTTTRNRRQEYARKRKYFIKM